MHSTELSIPIHPNRAIIYSHPTCRFAEKYISTILINACSSAKNVLTPEKATILELPNLTHPGTIVNIPHSLLSTAIVLDPFPGFLVNSNEAEVFPDLHTLIRPIITKPYGQDVNGVLSLNNTISELFSTFGLDTNDPFWLPNGIWLMLDHLGLEMDYGQFIKNVDNFRLFQEQVKTTAA